MSYLWDTITITWVCRADEEDWKTLHARGGRVGCCRHPQTYMDSITLYVYLNPKHPPALPFPLLESNFNENPCLRIDHLRAPIASSRSRRTFLKSHLDLNSSTRSSPRCARFSFFDDFLPHGFLDISSSPFFSCCSRASLASKWKHLTWSFFLLLLWCFTGQQMEQILDISSSPFFSCCSGASLASLCAEKRTASAVFFCFMLGGFFSSFWLTRHVTWFDVLSKIT